jgi:hypothetical protein
MSPSAHEEYLRKAAEGTFEKLSESAVFIALFTKAYMESPITLLQLGMAVVLDKPILLVVKRGTSIPDNVRRLARAIEEYDTDDDFQFAAERLAKRIKDIVPE